MPLFELSTTLGPDAFPDDFHTNVAMVCSTVLQAPLRSIVVSLHTNQRIQVGETTGEQLVNVVLTAHNIFVPETPEGNRKIIGAIFDHLIDSVGLPDKSIRIILVPLSRNNVGIPVRQLVTDVLAGQGKPDPQTK